MIGKTISHFRILEKVGEGGMGAVYRAEDTRLHRTVALKLNPHTLLSPGTAANRFFVEAQALATVNHPNVAHIYEVDEFEGQPFIAMEFVEGITLQQTLEARGRDPLPVEEALRYALQLAEGLEAIHARGVIHRDVKDTNVLVDPRGRIKITDFGLAFIQGKTRITREGATLGTVAFMSPEQARGEDVDHRTDIWSFGVILYEMLSGRLPFSSTYDQAAIYAILNEDPPPIRSLRPELDKRLSTVVDRALAKNRDDRFPDFSSLLAELRPLATPGGTATVTRRPKRFRLRRFVLPALVCLGVIIAAIVWHIATRKGDAEAPSIAVLPFENLGDSSNAYVITGLADAITNEIGKIQGLTVIASSSSFREKSESKDPRRIGAALGVRYVLEGTVQRSTSTLRVIARLLDVHSSRQLWSEKFDGTPDDLMRFQDDIAEHILTALKPTVSPGAGTVLNLRPTSSAEAYDLYLSGKFYVEKRMFENIDTAIALLQEAVDVDPQFALAYAALARAYSAKIFANELNRKLEEQASVAIEKALTIDPNLAEAHVARAALLWTRANGFPHELAAREALKALSINPNLLEAHEQIGFIYFHIGLLDKALEHFQRALVLDPTSQFAPSRIARLLWYQQRFAESLERFQGLPGWRWRDEKARVLQYLGRYDEAFAALTDTTTHPQAETGGSEVSPQEINADVAAGLALYYAGKQDTALALRNIALSRKIGSTSSHFHHAEYAIACAYALMKRNAEAVAWLQRTADDGFPCYPLFLNDPFLASLRSDPPYISFMAGMKHQWEYFRDTL